MITVLVASRNGSRYIRQQLDSILAQSHKDVHVLVSDDCSGDGTRELLAGYEQQHGDRVMVLNRKDSSGGAQVHFLKLMKMMADCAEAGPLDHREILKEYEAGRDQGIRLRRLAGAGYFMLSDQDDVWMPGKAETLLKRMQDMEKERGAQSRALLVHSDLRVVDEELNLIEESFFRYQKISPERTRLSQLLVQNNVTGGAVMFNRGMLAYLRDIPDTCLMHDAWLALVASCFGNIGCVEQPLYCYRQHGNNTLGAEKGDSSESVRARIKDGSSARNNYRKMFAQAECFRRMFDSRLSREQKETLEAFIRLPRCSRMGKIALILRYGFTKNTLLRTLGQMLFIGD